MPSVRMMGQGIAQTSAQFGYHALLADVSPEIAAKGKARMTNTLDTLVGRGTLDAAEAKTTPSHVTPAGKYALLAGTDIITEAATEREEMKHKILWGS